MEQKLYVKYDKFSHQKHNMTINQYLNEFSKIPRKLIHNKKLIHICRLPLYELYSKYYNENKQDTIFKENKKLIKHSDLYIDHRGTTFHSIYVLKKNSEVLLPLPNKNFLLIYTNLIPTHY